MLNAQSQSLDTIVAPAFGAWLSAMIWKDQSDEDIVRRLEPHADRAGVRVDVGVVQEPKTGRIQGLLIVHAISQAWAIPLVVLVSRLAEGAELTRHPWRPGVDPDRRKPVDLDLLDR